MMLYAMQVIYILKIFTLSIMEFHSTFTATPLFYQGKTN